MKRKRMGIGAAIGAILGAVLYNYLLAFEPRGFSVGSEAFFGPLLIGMILGAFLGWVFSRPRPPIEEVLGRPTSRRGRIVAWAATVLGLALAVGAWMGDALVAASGWLEIAAAWALLASGAAERARGLLYLAGGVFLLGLLSLGTSFLLSEL